MKKPLKISLKKCFGALFFAGLLAVEVLAAEIGADPNRTPATPRSTDSVPETIDPRTGLPPAPAEKMGTGIGSRGLTGNDTTPSPGPTKPIVPEPIK